MHNIYMKKNQKGFAVLELLLIAGVLVAIGIVGWTVYSKYSGSDQSAGEEAIVAKEGKHVYKMLPGKTIVKLPSGDKLRFGNAGSGDSVPDFIFGTDYILNDEHKINWLPIKNKLVTYHNGYQYNLTNRGCSTERRFDIDVEITVVTSCDIEVISTKKGAPQVASTSFTAPLSITEKAGSPIRSILKADPYLFVGANNIRVTKNGMEVYSDSGDWKINIITNYGIETINYKAEELYAKQTKSVSIGPAKVDVVIDSLTCTSAYKPELGCASQYATVYDKIDFSVKYSSYGGDQDVKILDYQE